MRTRLNPNGVDEYTELLLHVDSDFTDSSGNGRTATAVGDAAIDNTQSRFGGGSVVLDGTGDYLTIPHDSDFWMVDKDWTISLFINATTLGRTNVMVAKWNTNLKAFDFRLDASDDLLFYYSVDGTTNKLVQVAWAPSVDTWYHIELNRAGPLIYFFVDGNLQGTAQSVSTDSIFPSTQLQSVGVAFAGAAGASFAGRIDELNITIGTARHIANFVAPTIAYGLDTSSPGVTFEQVYVGAFQNVPDSFHRFATNTPSAVEARLSFNGGAFGSWANLNTNAPFSTEGLYPLIGPITNSLFNTVNAEARMNSNGVTQAELGLYYLLNSTIYNTLNCEDECMMEGM
jgi:hypothetical protein